ncbi:MAG: hypothetical protein JJE19_06990 [Methanosarcinales archaeon]|nr:hypothetical protein [Methanosarcinales archaeon]
MSKEMDEVRALIGQSKNYERANQCERFFEWIRGWGRFCENCSLWDHGCCRLSRYRKGGGAEEER